MNQKVKGVVLVAIILVAIGFIARNLTRPANKPVQVYEEVLVDVVANKVFLQELDITKVDAFPIASPYSEGKNAYPALQCENDGTICAHRLNISAPDTEVTDPGQVAGPPKCPVCGNILMSKPQLPEGVKEMDVEGPVKIVP